MDEKLVNSKKDKTVIFAMIFLVFVIILTIWLFVVNFFYQKSIDKISAENENISKAIENFKSKKELQLYSLISSYKWELSEKEKNSQILTFLEHLDEIEKKYEVNFSWFNLDSGEIKTEVTVRKLWIKWEKEAYSKVKNFIENYRDDKDALFDVKFINSFEWMDEIKFNLSLKIKKDILNKKENLNNNKN